MSTQPTGSDSVNEMALRGLELRWLTKQMLDTMGDVGRDRLLQRHLAQARGPELNAVLLRSMTRFIHRARAALIEKDDRA